jgi:hypothetical protein
MRGGCLDMNAPAERRTGQLLAEMEKATGGRPKETRNTTLQQFVAYG